ncbi:Glutamine amidotransferase chain of NAD synthetase [hydrothermal vent metagenome]|uniref:Glutamine amidotransferase chain of NAD synthetase n=1 Tax=hydrothermal vent metagenome TaxID=652676 RepID=A0A3B0TWQ7_9ZZZZ
MQKSVLRVACAQLIHPEKSALEVIGHHTIAPHLETIARARKKNVDILVFPELSLTGYSFAARHQDLALFPDAEQLLSLARASADMTTGVGFIEQSSSGLLYNSFAWLKQGKVTALHRKLNLPNYGQLDEGKYFAAGHHITTQDLFGHWSMATLICADVWNPALVHLAALQNPSMLVCPFASTKEAVGKGFDNPTGWTNTFRFYSMMYGLPGLYCNWIGPVDGVNFTGGSSIIDANGSELARAKGGEEMILAELDYQQITDARMRLPTIRTSRPDLILRELERIHPALSVPSSAPVKSTI